MSSRTGETFFPLLGLGFAVAGADKLLGVRGYERLFARWGWQHLGLSLVGAAEFLGGVMVASRTLRHRGGLLLSAASTAVLTKELARSEPGLALPRIALLAGALGAALFGRR